MAYELCSQEAAGSATFERLADDHRAAFERLARRMSRSVEDGEDLLQETLLDAYRSFPGFKQGTSFYSWVARIMTNNHLDRSRRRRHITLSLEHWSPIDGPQPLEIPDHSGNPERHLIERRLDPGLARALNALPEHHRECITLIDLHEATYEEAAAAQSCPVGTIRSRLHRAHASMQRLVASMQEDECTYAAAAARGRSRIAA